MRAHLYTFAYRYLRPLPPLPPSVSRRDGRTWASILRGIFQGATLPRSRAVRSPVRARRCSCGGLGVPPSRWLHLPSEAQAQEPPPAGRHTACCAPVPRGAPLTVCPTCCPATPVPHCCVPMPAVPAHGGRGGRGCTAPGGEVDHPAPDTPHPEQQPVAAPVPAVQHALLHPAAQILLCSTLLPLFAEGWGGTWILPSSKPPFSPLLLAVPGRRGFTQCPVCPRRCSECGRDGAKNVHQARAPPSLPHAPTAGSAHGRKGGGGSDAVAGCTATGVPAATAPQGT